MVRSHHRFGVSAVACLLGLTTTSWGIDFPCVGGRCLPRSASAAPAEPAAAPADEEEPEAAQVAAASGPVMFTAPAPSGEVQGARSSFLLPSIEFSLPSLSLGLPQFRLMGMGRNRREAHMKLDQGTAPMANGAPAVYGPLLGASLQSRAAAPAAAASPNAAPAAVAPASNNWVDPCALREQQEEVRQLTQQVQQLQGFLLQLAEQQAATQSADARDEEQPAREVSYVPRKAQMVSNTRPVRTSSKQKSAAFQRLQELKQTLEDREAEVKDLMAEQEEIEASERQEIREEEELLTVRKNQLESERIARLRNRMAKQSAPSEPVARKASVIEQTKFEGEGVANLEDLVPVTRNKVMSEPSRMKWVPAAPIRKTPTQVFDDGQ